MIKNNLTSIILGVFVLMAIYYIIEIFRLRLESKKRHQDIEWNLQQLSRALDLINSKSEQQILLGLEILYAINHAARLRALPRLTELASDRNSRIARQATKIIEVLSHATVPLRQSPEKIVRHHEPEKIASS